MRLPILGPRESSTRDRPRHGQHACLVAQLAARYVVVVRTRAQEDILIHAARDVVGAEGARRAQRTMLWAPEALL